MADFEKEIKEALVIQEAELPSELKDQSTKQFYYGAMWARAVRAERAQKLTVETTEAELSQEFRQLMLAEKPTERVTEKMLKEYIANHPKYKAEQEKLIQLGLVCDMFSVAKDAFEVRAKMLIELARQDASQRFYENEVKAMKEEFERREEAKVRKRAKKEETDA